ncbi:WD40/YVTN/BNR-like repeat-containing protein [Flavobacterium ammonificans]|uniref:Oxidoreductase n=1 Tax=Flavobacterium ammonificans TaxID=1751056 RepID=A0ABM7UZG0_9FLAO|nr:oxidoreductase [Flavobacterium ammonificans]BDB52958.1 hypothetical protein GENT11_12700 [Flavobacterium ammonificans]
MKQFLVYFLVFLTLSSCSSIGLRHSENQSIALSGIERVDTLLMDKISIRAITIANDKVWYSADKSRFGCIDLVSLQKKEIEIGSNKQTEFRSIAQTKHFIFVLSVANPALLYRIDKQDLSYELVYHEQHEKVFYDSMQFWNDKEGIAIGDPIASSFSLIVTKDSGKTWQKIPASQLPKLEEGEAFFAASNTSIITKKEKTWVVSGGKQSRVFFSNNKGKNWEVYSTPIVQGKSMTGIFTADFYNDKIGFISGGNYENLEQNYDNKALTLDGGKTWNLVAQNLGFGYASCVQYVPRSKGNELVSVGASGIFYSGDRGHTWKQFSSDKTLYTIRMINDVTAVATGKNKIILIHFKK